MPPGQTYTADLHQRLEHVPICVEQGIPAAGSDTNPLFCNMF
ncbi:hypothetical protein L842_0499 [Mycobacterium intracellulare MIN_052511_1280]|nr:hypothetical protein L842_0499 [Mycobacterium intracellulare MIN_052511_1280]